MKMKEIGGHKYSNFTIMGGTAVAVAMGVTLGLPSALLVGATMLSGGVVNMAFRGIAWGDRTDNDKLAQKYGEKNGEQIALAKHFVEGAIVTPLFFAAIPGAVAVNLLKELKDSTVKNFVALRNKFNGDQEENKSNLKNK